MFRRPHSLRTRTVRNKKARRVASTDIPVPDVAHAAHSVLPGDEELEALAAGLRRTEAAKVWLMYGCGLRIGEVLPVRTRCRINNGTPCLPGPSAPADAREGRRVPGGRAMLTIE